MINFSSPKLQNTKKLKTYIKEIHKVISSGDYILGKNVKKFEKKSSKIFRF